MATGAISRSSFKACSRPSGPRLKASTRGLPAVKLPASFPTRDPPPCTAEADAESSAANWGLPEKPGTVGRKKGAALGLAGGWMGLLRSCRVGAQLSDARQWMPLQQLAAGPRKKQKDGFGIGVGLCQRHARIVQKGSRRVLAWACTWLGLDPGARAMLSSFD